MGKSREYFTDSDGRLYTERPVVSKLGVPIGRMVFRVSEKEPVPLLMAAVCLPWARYGKEFGMQSVQVGLVYLC